MIILTTLSPICVGVVAHLLELNTNHASEERVISGLLLGGVRWAVWEIARNQMDVEANIYRAVQERIPVQIKCECGSERVCVCMLVLEWWWMWECVRIFSSWVCARFGRYRRVDVVSRYADVYVW